MNYNQINPQYILVPVIVQDQMYECVPVCNTQKIQLPLPEKFYNELFNCSFKVQNEVQIGYNGEIICAHHSNINESSFLLNQNNASYLRYQPALFSENIPKFQENYDATPDILKYCCCNHASDQYCERDSFHQQLHDLNKIKCFASANDLMQENVEKVFQKCRKDSYLQTNQCEEDKVSERATEKESSIGEEGECLREELIRNQLQKDNDALMSKEEMYHELLKPYQYKRVRVFDETTQKTRYYYICGYEGCSKQFNKGWSILDHVRMHENIRPFKCEHCDRSFTQKCNLKKHNRRHLVTKLRDRKRFKCLICGKGFTERYNLKAHMQKHQ